MVRGGWDREWSDKEVRGSVPTFSKQLTLLITNVDYLKRNS
jgi:hypothetical protein